MFIFLTELRAEKELLENPTSDVLPASYIDLLKHLASVRTGQMNRVMDRGGRTTFDEVARHAGTDFSAVCEIEEALQAMPLSRGKKITVSTVH